MAYEHAYCTHICGRKTTCKHLHSWKDNIKMGLRQKGWEQIDWINLAQDKNQGANTCESGNEPTGTINCDICLTF